MSEVEQAEDVLGSPPQFSPQGTRFSFEAEKEFERLTADFTATLRTRAIEKGQKMDQVQSTHVQEAHGELVATKVDVIADLGMAVGFPLGLLFLGIVIDDMSEWLKNGTALHPLSLVFALASGLFVGASLIINNGRYGLKRLFKAGGRSNAVPGAKPVSE